MPVTHKKRFRDRAEQSWHELQVEKEQRGSIRDGNGKRYRIGADLLLGERPERALAYFSWFAQEFPDDIGEPFHLLYWALAELRNGGESRAQDRLKLAMLSNLYLIPQIIGAPIETVDMWHGSNWRESSHLKGKGVYLSGVNEEERGWIQRNYLSPNFITLREMHTSTFHSLLTEKNYEVRGKLLDRLRAFVSASIEIDG